MASRSVVEEAEGLWLPSEFPYDLHETQYDAVEDMTLRLPGKLKLNAVGGPIVSPARNTAAQFYCSLPKITNPSVFHHMQLQRQLHLYKIRRAEELRRAPPGPTRTVRSGFIGGSRACAGTGVFLPRTYENGKNTHQYVHAYSSDVPMKPGRASPRGLISKNIDTTRFDVPQSIPQTHSLMNKAMIPDYDSLVLRHHMIMLQQRFRLLSDEKSTVMCHPQEWTY